MKKRTLKLMVSALVIGMIGIGMVGCGNTATNESKTDNKASSNEVTGSITVSGSSALLPLMEKTNEKFNAKNPKAEVGAQAGGSGTGLTQVLDGTVDIGNSDVFAEDKLDKAKAETWVDHKVVAQGLGVVVRKSLGIES